MDKEKLLQLKNQVEPFLNDLNKIVILNDMTIEDVRVLSEISIISNKISEIFKQYNINFLADSFNAIDLMINTTMFGNIEYSIALSYSMHLIEILSETLEVYFIGGILQNKTIIQSYQDMLFNWTEKNIPLEEKFHDETEIKDEDENIFKKIADLKGFPSLPENLKELNGLFINFSLENLEFIDDFISESYEILSLTVQKLLDIEKNCNDYELINEIFRSIHTIKGSAGFLGLTEMTVVSHWTETLLDKCRNNEIKFNSDIIDVILKSTDILKELLKNIQLKVKELRGEQKNIELKEIFIENILNSLVNVITDNSKIKDESKENLSDKNLKNVKTKTSIINHNEKQNKEIVKSIQNNDELQTDSIRIPINKLDSLYEMIGETLISVSILKQSAVLLKNSDKSFIEKIDYLDMLTDQLQMRMLKMRMFPIKSVYDKLNRQVRDLIKKSGKSVDFSVFGGETEVDKIIIDEIFAPLTHIIRNSMDHGLEMPDRRFAKGKNKTGMIKLKTENRGDNVIIEIFDDGSGLNKNKILSKAIEKQLIIEQDKLDDSEIYNFIFAPGFSTADAVTEISGRGVGMDVVKKTIDKLGGKIDIETEIDKFTKITITLPVSTSIIDGLIVKKNNSKYIFPVLKIKQTIDANSIDIKSTYDTNNKFIIFYNKTIPLISLNYIYEKPRVRGAKYEDSDNVIIIIEFENKYFGIMVDEIICKQKVVTKNFGGRFKNIPGLKGGAILGDGSVGMIIEPGEIVRELKKNSEYILFKRW